MEYEEKKEEKTLSCHIYSSVGGGTVERLMKALNSTKIDAEQIVLYDSSDWREKMSKGRYGKLSARFLAFTKFPINSLIKALQTTECVIVPTTNPFFLPHFLLATSAWHGHHVVPIIYDMYPDAWEATGLAEEKSWISYFATFLNKWMFKNADAIVFIGEKMANAAIDRYGEPQLWNVIETGADLKEFEKEKENDLDAESDLAQWLRGRVLITYTGNLGLVHDWNTLTKGIEKIVTSPLKKEVAFLVVASGPGGKYLKEKLEGYAPDAIRFEEALDDNNWARIMAKSCITIVTLSEKAVNTSIPSKTFSGMAAGNAIVAISPKFSDLYEVVSRHQCGKNVCPGDVDGFVLAIKELVRDPEWRSKCIKNAEHSISCYYNMPVLAEKWKRLLGKVGCRNANLPGYETMKRIVDIVVAATGITVTAPIMISAAVAIRSKMGAPVLFRQKRPGRWCKPFEIVKFRTMSKPRDGEKWFRTDSLRLSTLGRFLRKTSIDELPELFNVLKGQMSIVGPRPLLMEYIEKYTKEEIRRHDVLPGITGWAQINGRQNIPFSKRLKLDVWYVDNRNLLVDFKILVKTLKGIVNTKGVVSGQNVDDVDDLGLSSDRLRK